jgi:hypothetical protein
MQYWKGLESPLLSGQYTTYGRNEGKLTQGLHTNYLVATKKRKCTLLRKESSFFPAVIEHIISWLVTIDGVRIDNWIYCTLTTRNYNQLQRYRWLTHLLSTKSSQSAVPSLSTAWQRIPTMSSSSGFHESGPHFLATGELKSKSRYDRRSVGQ